MFGFDRNGLQVGQVTSWVFVVDFSPFFFPVYFGFTGRKLLVLCKHGTPRAPYISRATAFIALSHGHVIATDTCFYNTASIICR